MPRHEHAKIYKHYIADGFAEDCEDLFNNCSKVSKLSYEKFCIIWKESNFSCIFKGRPTGTELAEFSEEVIHVAKYFMVNNINNFEKSVASLFLLYALLNLQPFSRFAALRLGPEDVAALQHIEKVARSEKRHDILYILGHIFIIGPCQYHVSARERSMEYCYRRYFDECPEDGPMGVRRKGVITRHNEEVELIQELKYLEQCYITARNAVTDTNERSLCYTSDKTAAELESSLRTVASGLWIEMEDKQTDEGPKEPEHSVASIKEKAMKRVVDPMRHLIAVDDKKISKKQPDKEIPKSSTETTTEPPKRRPKRSPNKYHWSLKTVMQHMQPPNQKEQSNKPTSTVTSNKDMFAIDLDDKISDSSIKSDKTATCAAICDKSAVNDNKDEESCDKTAITITLNENRVPKEGNKLKCYNANNKRKKFTKQPTLVPENGEIKNKSKIIFEKDVPDTGTNINIDLDKIPIVINTDSKTLPFEIEIIDEYKSNNSETENNKSENKTKVNNNKKAKTTLNTNKKAVKRKLSN